VARATHVSGWPWLAVEDGRNVNGPAGVNLSDTSPAMVSLPSIRSVFGRAPASERVLAERRLRAPAWRGGQWPRAFMA
jgi:hypothetical protein